MPHLTHECENTCVLDAISYIWYLNTPDVQICSHQLIYIATCILYGNGFKMNQSFCCERWMDLFIECSFVEQMGSFNDLQGLRSFVQSNLKNGDLGIIGMQFTFTTLGHCIVFKKIESIGVIMFDPRKGEYVEDGNYPVDIIKKVYIFKVNCGIIADYYKSCLLIG